jgi:excisionase family DNA binding protein
MTTSATAGLTIIERLKLRTSYVTSTEAMVILGVTRQTLCRWVTEGRIPAVRIGPSNKFDPAHLADWLEERQIGVAA